MPRPLFAVLLLIFLPLIPAAQAGAPLAVSTEEWYPGLIVEFDIHAEASRWLTAHSVAGVSVAAGDVVVAIDAEGRGVLGVDMYLVVTDGGRVVRRVDLPDPGVGEKIIYDGTVRLVWPCNGDPYVEVVLSTPVHAAVKASVEPGEPPVQLTVHSEEHSGITIPDSRSWAVVSDVDDERCWRGPGDKPPVGGGSKGGEREEPEPPYLWAALGFAAAGVLVLALARRG